MCQVEPLEEVHGMIKPAKTLYVCDGCSHSTDTPVDWAVAHIKKLYVGVPERSLLVPTVRPDKHYCPMCIERMWPSTEAIPVSLTV